jgi:hypothetical protein
MASLRQIGAKARETLLAQGVVREPISTVPPTRGSIVFEGVLVVAFFTAVAVFATWPLAVHPLGGFYGFGNDNWGGITYQGWLHDAYLGSGSAAVDPELQAPFGLTLPGYAFQPVDRLFALALGGFGQGLLAYNAQIFSSFVLAGCTMYLLARQVTGSPLAALVSGFIFTFSPFHLALGMQYNALASIEWIPLYLLALVMLLDSGRPRDAALAGAAFALVALGSYYYAWFIGCFTLLLLGGYAIVRMLPSRRSGESGRVLVRRAISRSALAAGVAIAVAAPFLATSARGAAEAGSQSLTHPITEGIRYSARPWMLFIPPHDNPFVGESVRPWVTQRLYDSPIHEQSIFLGYTAFALAIAAFWRLRSGSLSKRAKLARIVFAAGALIGLVIMMGPYLPLERSYWRDWQTPGSTAHMPSLGWLMFQVAPVFRFFSRAFVLVSACLAVLAAIGFARLERRLTMTPARRILLAAAVLALVALEFANAPPHVWTSGKRPTWVSAVKRLPPTASVVDYPIAPAFSPRSLYYMFWQADHRRSTMNPAIDSAAVQLAANASAPDDPASGRTLHDAGIDFAIVHTKLPPQTRPPYQPQLAEDSMPANAGALNPWFEVVARSSDATIYRVLDSPRREAGAVVRAGAGFGGAEPEAGVSARWLEQQTGTLTMYVTGRPRRLRLALTLGSFAQPRRARLTFDGKSFSRFSVPPGAYVTRAISLGQVSPGRHTIMIAANPGPQSISAVTGSGDPRSVSIRLREPIVVSAKPRRVPH